MNNKQQESRINDALFEIHKDISASLTGKYLAHIAAYSEQHFHRTFKKIVGQTLNVYIRQTRLEHAANQLMFDQNSSILEIAEKCGFVSLSSFNHAFKAHFNATPGQWKKSEKHSSKPPYLQNKEVKAGYQRMLNTRPISPEIVSLAPRHVAYIRHRGYGREISQTWQILKTWAFEKGIRAQYNALDNPLSNAPLKGQEIGLHHSNPEWVKLENCRYVACITLDQPLQQRGIINGLTIPGGSHAAFNLQGQYGDLLPFIGKILNNWLPSSGFKLQTTPIFIHYKKNHFLSNDDLFDVRIFIPISVV